MCVCMCVRVCVHVCMCVCVCVCVVGARVGVVGARVGVVGARGCGWGTWVWLGHVGVCIYSITFWSSFAGDTRHNCCVQNRYALKKLASLHGLPWEQQYKLNEHNQQLH